MSDKFNDEINTNEHKMYRSTVLQNLVRGLGVHRHPEVLIELAEATGYDYVNYKPLYSADTTLKVLEFLKYRYYSSLPEAEAYRALGRCMFSSWINTPFGKVTIVALPILNPTAAIKFLPSIFDRVRFFGKRWLTQESRTRWIFNLTEEPLPPDYIAGQMEAAAGLITQVEECRIILGPILSKELTQITIEVILLNPN